MGAQGPDVFFYSHLVRGRHGRPDLALLTHQHRMAAAFRSMLGRAATAPAEERGAAFAFVAGYATHLCLDAEAHPWVLYWTGDITDGADPPARAEAFRRHGILEASMDVILARERSDDTAWLRRQRLLRLPPAQAMTAGTLLSGMLDDVHGVTFTRAEGRSAFRAMEWVYTTMRDPRALLTRLLGMVAPAVDKSGVVRTQIYPETPAPAAAGLYAGRRPWYYPSLPDEPRTTTFAEILAAAHGGGGGLPRGHRRRGRRRRGRGRGGGRHRRPKHAHRPGLRRPASAGRLRARPRSPLGGRRPGLTPVALSASS